MTPTFAFVKAEGLDSYSCVFGEKSVSRSNALSCLSLSFLSFLLVAKSAVMFDAQALAPCVCVLRRQLVPASLSPTLL